LDDEFPNIIYSVAKILRLSDDLEGAKVWYVYVINMYSQHLMSYYILIFYKRHFTFLDLLFNN
jgi:hypothetical protein